MDRPFTAVAAKIAIAAARPPSVFPARVLVVGSAGAFDRLLGRC